MATDTHFEFNSVILCFRIIINEFSSVLRYGISTVFLACRVLFVRGAVLCLMLQYFNTRLTFVIMWCVEDYCDMHQ